MDCVKYREAGLALLTDTIENHYSCPLSQTLMRNQTAIFHEFEIFPRPVKREVAMSHHMAYAERRLCEQIQDVAYDSSPRPVEDLRVDESWSQDEEPLAISSTFWSASTRSRPFFVGV